jgi:hypothetical protein
MVDYGCMWGVYRLLYKIPIFNSPATIVQSLTIYYRDELFIDSPYFQKDNCIVVVIPKG